jgi:hypothetical protein
MNKNHSIPDKALIINEYVGMGNLNKFLLIKRKKNELQSSQ